MKTLVNFNFFLCLIISFYCVFKGLDLKKWSSWFFGVYGFFSGFLAGLYVADIRGGFQLGSLIAFGVMYAGAMSRIHRMRFGNDK